MNMKFILISLLSMSCILGANAQKNEKAWARVYINGKFGIISKTGVEIVKPDYDLIGSSNNKLIPVISNGEAYAINETGQRTSYTPETKGKVIPFIENSKWGLKTDKGEVLADPKYDFIGKFNDGRAVVSLNGKAGLISDKGKEIVSPMSYNFISDFDKGKAIVLKDTLYGLVDDKGVEIISPQYHLIQRIKGNNYLMMQGGLWGVLNSNGRESVAPKYSAIFACKDGFQTFSGGKIGMLADDGNLMFEPTYDEVGVKDNNVFIVVLDGRYGLLNKNGKQIIKPTYQYIDEFDSGRAFILRDNLWGVINTDGTEIVKPQYNAIEQVKDNCYKVYKDDKQGILDKDGKIIVQPIYNDISIF